MRYVEAPDEYAGGSDPTLFLAGGITDCPDWQRDAWEQLADSMIVVFNPRRAEFPMDDPSAALAQIKWEHRHLQMADVILFWFCAEAVQPIALYELGAWSSTGKPIVVGAHPAYVRRADVVIQTGLARPLVTVADSLVATVGAAQRMCWELAALRRERNGVAMRRINNQRSS